MDGKLYCFRLEDPSGEFEPATELLDALELQYSSFFDRENMSVIHTVYAASRPEAEKLAASVSKMMPMWKDMEVEFSMGEIFELEKHEWADAWKKYFRPVEISPSLLVTPAWIVPENKPGQTVLKIDTGMSFGTGQHPTTLYCLQEIDRLSRNGGGSMLDAGCGTGILAIAAAMLGFSTVDAFDFDPDAVEISVENLAMNKVNIVKPEIGDAAVWQGRPEKYDLVCANILGHLLIAFRKNIATWVKPGGTLVLAGILSTDFDKVSAAFQELGFTEVKRSTIKEWTGGTFTW